MTVHLPSNVVLEANTELIDVTSLSRPDVSWSFTDTWGHTHRWYDGDQPATDYRPDRHYTTPTLRSVSDGTYWCADCADDHETSHLECRLCGQHVEPRCCADTWKQFIKGITTYTVTENGSKRHITLEEFQRIYDEKINR